MLERLGVLAVLVAGCGRQPSYPAPLYAGLFVEGATFHYELVTHSSHVDDQGSVDDHSTSTITCTVGKVEKLKGAVAAPLACDQGVSVPVGGAGPEGIYVATAHGLWRVDSMPADLGKPPMIPAAPIEHAGGLEREPGETWCASNTFTQGDEGGTQKCFAHGVLVSGSSFSSGGSSHEASYVLLRRQHAGDDRVE